jgi:hypothetical protein
VARVYTKYGYVERVRALLGADLSREDLDTLVADLEEQLEAFESAEVEGRIGSPEEFVATFRASADIRPRDTGLAAMVELWLDAQGESGPGSMWRQYQPAWWAIRGWILVITYLVTYAAEPTFRPFPSDWFVLIVCFMVGSVVIGMLVRRLPGRLLNILLSATTVYMVFVAAING